jgi:hypothetical protein
MANTIDDLVRITQLTLNGVEDRYRRDDYSGAMDEADLLVSVAGRLLDLCETACLDKLDAVRSEPQA